MLKFWCYKLKLWNFCLKVMLMKWAKFSFLCPKNKLWGQVLIFWFKLKMAMWNRPLGRSVEILKLRVYSVRVTAWFKNKITIYWVSQYGLKIRLLFIACYNMAKMRLLFIVCYSMVEKWDNLLLRFTVLFKIDYYLLHVTVWFKLYIVNIISLHSE